MVHPKFTYPTHEIHSCIFNKCRQSLCLDIEEFITDEFYDKLEWPAILGIRTKVECLKQDI
jgi:hypothetical protein